MKTKIPAFCVNSENPFESDALNREKTCVFWTKFIQMSTTPYVLAVDSEWGNGKTVFLQMWQAHLEKNGFRSVFFDAWRSDFYGDALPALIGEVQQQLGKHPKFKALKKACVNVAKALPWAVLQRSAEAIGGQETVKAAKDSLKKWDKIESYLKYQRAVDEFRTALTTFAESATEGNTKIQRDSGKPLVFFIDELDRCRPTFALDVLEKIKHVFNAEGVFFVIAVNKAELGETLKTVYGNINDKVYFQKFFDLTIPLRNEDNLAYSFISRIELPGHFEKRHELCRNENLKSHQDEESDFGQYLSLYFETFNLSLRVQEQIVSALSVILRMYSHKAILFPPLLCYFLVIRFVNPDLFGRSVSSIKENDDYSLFPFKEHLEFYNQKTGIQAILEQGEYQDTLQHRRPYLLLCALYCANDNNFATQTIEEQKKQQAQYGYSGSYGMFLTGVLKIFRQNRYNPSYPSNLRHILDKINFVGHFIFDEKEGESGQQ